MEEKLIESCRRLHYNNVINDRQLENCQKNLGNEETNNFLRNRDKFEIKKFGESRMNKKTIVKDFLDKLNKIKNNYSSINKLNIGYDKFNNNLRIINNKIKKMIKKNYSSKEDSNYLNLLNISNNLENNKNSLKKIENEIITLKKQKLISKQKKNNVSMILSSSLVVILVIVIIIIIKLFYF